MQLVDDGTGLNTLLQIDYNGTVGGASWETVLKLDGTHPGDFTREDFNPGYSFDGTGFVIHGTAGNDTLVGSADGDTIDGQDGNDNIDGGDGNDCIQGNSAPATTPSMAATAMATGGIDGGRTATTIGRPARHDYGDDSIDTRRSAPTITLYGGDGNDNLNAGGGTANYLEGDNGNDTLVAGAGANTMYGGSGNDSLDDSAATGNSYLQGDDGSDTILGGSGNDTFASYDASSDSESGGAGNDYFQYVDYYAGSDTITGGAGADTYQLYSYPGQPRRLRHGDHGFHGRFGRRSRRHRSVRPDQQLGVLLHRRRSLHLRLRAACQRRQRQHAPANRFRRPGAWRLCLSDGSEARRPCARRLHR